MLSTPKHSGDASSSVASSMSLLERGASAAAIRALHLTSPNHPAVKQPTQDGGGHDDTKAPQNEMLSHESGGSGTNVNSTNSNLRKGVGLGGVLRRLSDLESWLGDVRCVGSRADRCAIGIESPGTGPDGSPSVPLAFTSLTSMPQASPAIDRFGISMCTGSPDCKDNGSLDANICNDNHDKESRHAVLVHRPCKGSHDQLKERALRRHTSAPAGFKGSLAAERSQGPDAATDWDHLPMSGARAPLFGA